MQMRKKKKTENGLLMHACRGCVCVVHCRAPPRLTKIRVEHVGRRFSHRLECINEILWPQPPSPPPYFRQTDGIIGDSYILCDLQSICRWKIFLTPFFKKKYLYLFFFFLFFSFSFLSLIAWPQHERTPPRLSGREWLLAYHQLLFLRLAF